MSDRDRLEPAIHMAISDIESSPVLLDEALGVWLENAGRKEWSLWFNALHRFYCYSDGAGEKELRLLCKHLMLEINRAVDYYAEVLAAEVIKEEDKRSTDGGR